MLFGSDKRHGTFRLYAEDAPKIGLDHLLNAETKRSTYRCSTGTALNGT